MLGELEQIVMLAVLRVGDDAYGVPILDEIQRETGRELALATVYKTLSRLEEKGLVTSRVGEPTPQRGGRRRKHFELLPLGARALKLAYASFTGMLAGVEHRLKAL